jgi:hypothetical protein
MLCSSLFMMDEKSCFRCELSEQDVDPAGRYVLRYALKKPLMCYHVQRRPNVAPMPGIVRRS